MCQVRHACCAYANVFTVFLCQSHGSVRTVEQLSNPLNYVKPAVHLVIKFRKILWKKKFTSYHGVRLPHPSTRESAAHKQYEWLSMQQTGRLISFIWREPKKKNVTENDAEPPQCGFLHTDCYTLDLLFTASNTLSVNGLATWQEQNVEVDCGH